MFVSMIIVAVLVLLACDLLSQGSNDLEVVKIIKGCVIAPPIAAAIMTWDAKWIGALIIIVIVKVTITAILKALNWA